MRADFEQGEGQPDPGSAQERPLLIQGAGSRNACDLPWRTASREFLFDMVRMSTQFVELEGAAVVSLKRTRLLPVQ